MAETIILRTIEDDMRESYLDYAMSVIIGRAIPDARDGLKPVHRRILYAMHEMGNTHDKPHKKSARIVGECFVKDTLIATKHGLVPIQDIIEGDLVFTQYGEKRVTALFEMPECELIKVSLVNGIINTVTPSQKFKVIDGELKFVWKEAKDLMDGDFIVTRAVFPEVKTYVPLGDFKGKAVIFNENVAYLLGQLLSDGWIEKGYNHGKEERCGFCSASRAVIKRVASTLWEEFGYNATIEEHVNKEANSKGACHFSRMLSVRINSTELNRFLINKFRLHRANASTKKIPKQAFISPKSVIFSMISGMIDGDGSVHHNRNVIQYSSISEKMIRQTQMLLLHLGIFGKLYKTKSRPGLINGRVVIARHDSYSLEINGRYAQMLGAALSLSEPIKKERAVFRKLTTDLSSFEEIPYAAGRVFDELSNHHLGGGWYAAENGEKFRMGIAYPDGTKIRYSSDIREKMLTKSQICDWGILEKLERISSPLCGFFSDIIESNVHFLRVSSIEKGAPEKTYDIQVEEAHEFIANGMLSHNCLGKYHPHGDMAVYDSLVRMAQNFSLRYMLVDGQGNLGCFTKDTKVRLTDGRSLSFEELIKEDSESKQNFTFAMNKKTGKIEIAGIQKPRLTLKNAKIMKVVLDNGEGIRCTVNHRFMLRNGEYKEAQHLAPGDSLMPLYNRFATKEDDPNMDGYEMILQPIEGKWEYSHHLSDEWNLKSGVYAKSAGRIRHHCDFDKLNNNPDNIKRMNWKEHWKTHYELTAEKHKNDAEYRAKLARGRKEFWANPENRIKASERYTKRNTENWKKPEYRKKMSENLSRVNIEYIENHPEKRMERSERATKTLKRLWQDPAYRESMKDKIIKGNKNHTTNKTGKMKFINICKMVNEEGGVICEESYETTRNRVYPYGHATNWKTGLQKYFNNDSNLVMAELNGNHKVLKTEFLPETEDVYDLTIDGTHNFALHAGVFVHNSIDGDNAAAMRYTECRLSKMADDLLSDIEKETVGWNDNFDGTLKEPAVLPSRVPNLLINGSSGIAVGMATNMPPHNLREIVDGAVALIDGADENKILTIVNGPDFPTGGEILGRAGILQAYKTGRGHIRVRGKASVDAKRNAIVITEIPYQVTKTAIIEAIVEAVKAKRIEGISGVHDRSDKDGIEVLIDLKKGAIGEVVLNQIYAHTPLENTFGIINLVLVGKQPKILGIYPLINEFIEFRKEIVRKRCVFELKQAEDRAHILEGLRTALENIDSIVTFLKKTKDIAEARAGLIKAYSLSDKQANAILDMKISRLVALERQKIEDEYSGLVKTIAWLKDVLADVNKILKIIKEELLEVKAKYGDERRTAIVESEGDITDESLIPNDSVVIPISGRGYVKRVGLDEYKTQHRGGKGVMGAETKEEDFVQDVIVVRNHNHILFFTDKGRVFWLKAYQIPEAGRYASGKSLVNLLDLKEEKVTSWIPVPEFKPDEYLVMVTKNGIVKRTSLDSYSHPRKNGIIAITLRDNDQLVEAIKTNGKEELLIATKQGQAIRFDENDAREIGRSGMGVIGIRLKDKDDAVVGIASCKKYPSVLTITENGYGKRTATDEYRLQGRGGSGVINMKTEGRNGPVVGVRGVVDTDEIIVISSKGQTIRSPVTDISVIGRNTQGVRIIRLQEEEGETVASFAVVPKEEKAEGEV